MAWRSSFWASPIGIIVIDRPVTIGDIKGKVVYYETIEETEGQQNIGLEDQRILGIEASDGTLTRLAVELRNNEIFRLDTNEVLTWTVD